ncbi:MAG: MFS transporter [Alphaproteobacteria bacterium]|nr:MFS transporter [Alphaproteobacteria bacterium]
MGTLFFIVFIDLVGFGVVIPLLPYYGLEFHATPFAITTMMACYSLAQFVASPVLGMVSDRVGRKPVILASLVCSIVSYVWLGFAGQLWMLFAARLLAGAGAGNIAAAQAYVADVTPPEQRAKGMGMIGAAIGLGFTVGPAIGGLVAGGNAQSAYLAWPAFVAAALSAAAFALAFARLEESLTQKPAERIGRLAMARAASGRPVLRLLILLIFVSIAAFAGMETTFALWAHDGFGWGPLQVGLIFFYVGILLSALQGGAIGRLAKTVGETNLVVAGGAILAVGLLGITVANTLWVVLVASALLAVGIGMLSPATSSLISKEAAENERGGVLGLSQSAQSLARIVGPAIAGAVYGGLGRNAPYYLGALLMAGVAALAIRLPRQAPR